MTGSLLIAEMHSEIYNFSMLFLLNPSSRHTVVTIVTIHVKIDEYSNSLLLLLFFLHVGMIRK